MNPEDIDMLAQTLGVDKTDIQLITYYKKLPKSLLTEVDVFAESHIGWKGVLKTTNAKDFANTPFDVLVNYYPKAEMGAYALSAATQAGFKVGIQNSVPGLNDLVIHLNDQDFSVFAEELKKYLHILKIAS